MEKEIVVKNYLALLTRMNIFIGMIGDFITGTISAGKFIILLAGKMFLTALLSIEFLFIAFFAMMPVAVILKTLDTNKKETE